MAEANVYTFSRSGDAYTAARTLLQIATAAAKPIEILRCWCNQSGSTTSEQLAVAICRRTAAATGLTAAIAADIKAHNPSDAATSVQLGAALTGYGTALTADGTDTQIITEGFNLLGQGYQWAPTPAQQIIIAAGGFFALRLLSAPAASRTLYYGCTYREIG